MSNDARAVVVAYVVAVLVALEAGRSLGVEHPIAVALVADLAATGAIFAFSFFYRNSSFYDPYWSLAPIAIAAYWALSAPSGGAQPLRALGVGALVVLWGLRLTHNWYRGWEGLHREDWRYLGLRRASGRGYWLVSLAGIHLAPTLWVFLGCLPLYPVLAAGAAPLGWLDALAALVTGGAIALEARADQELLRFRREPHEAKEFLRTGLWALCRHPNYLGEMGFWWGLWLFALAAAPGWWWTGVGALAIAGMFHFVSLPMIEQRMRERRPDYAAWAERSSRVLPRWPRIGKEA
jgi:steroid 5-alpha reductase family enzyme